MIDAEFIAVYSKVLLIIVNWFSKSLMRSGLGVILRSLRNSPFVKQNIMPTASADSHPIATRYLSFSASYARAKERTQVLRSLRKTPSPQVKPFRAILLRQV